MLGEYFTNIPLDSNYRSNKMSTHSSQAQARVAVGEGPPVIVDREISLDGVYDALANERRREVLAVLAEMSHTISIRELARQIVLQERSKTTDSVTKEIITHAQISLHQLHLPKLVDFDLIVYDAEEQTVEGTIETTSVIHV